MEVKCEFERCEFCDEELLDPYKLDDFVVCQSCYAHGVDCCYERVKDGS